MRNRIPKHNGYGGINYYIYKIFASNDISYGYSYSGSDLKTEYITYIKKLYEE